MTPELRAKLKNPDMIITDELINKLGIYFVYNHIRQAYGWTFEEFIVRYLNDEYDQNHYIVGMDLRDKHKDLSMAHLA